MTSVDYDYKGFTKEDLLDRLGALGEEYMDIQHRKEELVEEMLHIQRLLEDLTGDH